MKENLIDSESDCYVNEDEIGFRWIEFALAPTHLQPYHFHSYHSKWKSTVIEFQSIVINYDVNLNENIIST